MEAVGSSARARSRRGISGGRIGAWIVFIAGVLYFFLPLVATLLFSLRLQPTGQAYVNVLVDDDRFTSTLIYSGLVGIATIVLSVLLIVPTAYWVRLRLPRARPYVEFITLLPFVIPPIILVFALLRGFSGPPFHLTGSHDGLNVLVTAAYVVLSFPYMYRAVDSGLRAIDVRTMTEAAQSMGAGWGRILWSVILPNLRVALISGAFLTLAIVIGEYTIASLLGRPAFGPYLGQLGRDKAYEPAAVTIVSFGVTWLAMGMIAFLGRGSRQSVQVAGAR
ncbi:MAG TPA: ABC transporter permease subunit [Patescibacteria group bacterium]|jgi:putative spermidine/putrescine transport system permease protein|nr:ABC transporter permease subunit [Patescibacteria group bacterium]